ncbi:Hydrolase (HAD superfamily) [Acidisarcina polymorpha]|uniref:Hydrolase (HAD superfamily) n=1 Tax=Acidisarcina polymorpha TaxID=2211140 RepID=A0A2Z5FWE6_9BACT|nr:Hydrolase (HAD superfamily) [Acidisarcina polymorpha]
MGVTAELDSLGVERFDLFGASLGAAIAVSIAAENPEKVNSVVLQSGFSFGGDNRLTLLFDLWRHLAKTDRVAFTKLILATGFTHHFLAAFDQPTVEAIIKGFVDSSDWSMIDEAIRVDMSVDIRDAATQIKAPTLVITAKHDQIVPPDYSEALAQLIPQASRSELDCGHLTFLERPSELAAALLEFFEAHHQSFTR